MTETTETPAPPTMAHEASVMLTAAHRAMLDHAAHVKRLDDDVRVMEEVLPIKRAAADRARADHASFVEMAREAMDFYRYAVGQERA